MKERSSDKAESESATHASEGISGEFIPEEIAQTLSIELFILN